MISLIFQNLNETKIIFVIFLLVLFSSSSALTQYKKQQFELTTFAGYQLTSNLQTFSGELKINNSFNYGAALDIRLSNDLLIELLYIRTETEVNLKKEFYQTIEKLFDMSVEYLQGGVQVETEAGPFRPFAAFTIGGTYFNPQNNSYDGDWKFSFTAGGGVKYYFTNNIGVRAQWRFLVPIYFSNTSIFCNNGYCGIIVSGGTYLLQYDLTTGLVFSF